MAKKFDYEKAHNLFYKMIQVGRAHRCTFESMHSAIGIHHSQHRMLMFISRSSDALSQKDIAKHFNISAAAVAVSLKKLEDGGYISRESLDSDSRFNSIKITDAGKKIALQSEQFFRDADKAMFESFSDEDYKNFEECLEKIMDGIKKYSIDVDTIQ